MDVINIIAIPLFAVALFFTCGQLVRRVTDHSLLVGFIGVLLAVIAPLLHEIYQLPFLAIDLVALIAGWLVSVTDGTFRKGYFVALLAGFGIVFSDLLYESGIGRSGIPPLRWLVDPQMAAFFVLSSLVGSVLAAVVALVAYFIARGVVRVTKGATRSNGAVWPIVLCALVIYIIEPQLHLNRQHPLWIHDPFATIATIAGLIVGYFGGRGFVLPSYHPVTASNLAFAFPAYFFAYHFIMETSELNGHGWLMLLAFAATLPFGSLFGVLKNLRRE